MVWGQNSYSRSVDQKAHGKIRNLPLQEYANNLCSCFEALLSMGPLAHFDKSTLSKLVDKLPGYIQSQFHSISLKLRKEKSPRQHVMLDWNLLRIRCWRPTVSCTPPNHIKQHRNQLKGPDSSQPPRQPSPLLQHLRHRTKGSGMCSMHEKCFEQVHRALQDGAR